MDVSDSQPQRRRPYRRAPAREPLNQPRHAAQHEERCGSRNDEDRGDALVGRREDRKRCETNGYDGGGNDVDSARPAVTFEPDLAKEGRGRNIASPAERQQREGQRHEHAEQSRHCQRFRVNAGFRRHWDEDASAAFAANGINAARMRPMTMPIVAITMICVK